MRFIDIINYCRPEIVNQLILFHKQGVTMLILEIITNIISHLIIQDRLINLRNIGTNGTIFIPFVIQTQIANQYHLNLPFVTIPFYIFFINIIYIVITIAKYHLYITLVTNTTVTKHLHITLVTLIMMSSINSWYVMIKCKVY